jgi:hypothetical protein
MTYQIRHRYQGIDVIDPDDNSATYIRYRDIPDYIDQLKEAYAHGRRREGVTAEEMPDSAVLLD